ncbi:MAG: TonB-dependent receptor [Crocinitomicaceae bacterium]|jgi:iron complex outermembrane recepter protein|nr:TonB-dependent receptor [Crocinitomicaceae bacterium]MDP4723904.1 TonB-dependent receptor [Crocinitomicaceae bacterium]MDP4740126.1 TonB-dependent receptor [Crocinitomicaceae bacterium]MDP4799970.1 TonB-dependent receptor [Crocinitomicaceae bacterium]MDP4806904.1 TonB-dependent receptor [Crocinitomicaceae bacterium]
MRLFLFALLAALPGLSMAQQKGKISGQAVMSPGDTPVAGAKITLLNQGTAVTRVATNDLGNYELLNIPYGKYQLVFTLPLSDTLRFDIQLNQASVVQNFSIRATQEEREVRVIGNLVRGQNVPVAVTKIDTKKINEELASRDLPMLLNGTAGVYATNQGGGDGDARINVRGFDQRNVGVMIDGVPVNDMENGAVYWSNWFGLDAITSQMQVQRGLGATKIAMPSIGGTINIITQGVGTKKGGSFKQEYATGNFLRSSLSYNTGMTASGWGLTFSASYKQGQGWVDGTPTQGFFGYTKISKRLDKHLITLSAFAAPQKHGQRSYNQGIQYWDANRSQNLGVAFDSTLVLNDMGIRYNQHWGYVTNANGEQEILNERRNFYNKPQITLKDFWSVNDKLDISNLAYLSVGRGGGTSIFNSSAILRDSNAHIDWDQMIAENQVNSLFGTPNIDPIYSPTEIKASQILLASMNNHFWLGYLGQFNYQYSKKTTISGGLDYRYYEGRHYQVITNLLGADYFVSTANFNDADPMQRVGDKIAKNTFNADRDGVVTYAGVFGQLEHNGERINWFANVSGVLNGYKGIDYFQRKVLDLGDTTLRIGALDTIQYNGQTYHAGSEGLEYFATDWKYIPGVTIKGGLSYKLNKYHDVYCNLGYLNRTPQFSNVIDNNTNSFFGEIVNEIIYSAEGGYHFSTKHFGINYNAYYTNWKNKPFPYGVAVPDPNDPTEFIRVNINGMDAIHMGQEVDVAWEISPKLSFDFMFSMGNWIWNSSKTVFIPQYDSLEFTFDAKGVHVGDAAQTAMAVSLRYEPIKNAYVKIQGQFFDRYYANFDPFSLQGANGGRDSWKIPSYSLINVFAGYRYKQFSVGGSVTNLLNTSFISDATNNANGIYDQFDARSATVMFGQGLRFNINLAIQF